MKFLKYTLPLLVAFMSFFAVQEAHATAGALVFHDAAKLRGYNGTGLNWNASDVLKLALATSASNAATTSVINYASLTNELSTANGYTSGGATASTTWTNSGATSTLALSSAVVWTASGGSIVARFAVLYDNTDTNKTIIGHFLLDATPADVTVTTGNTLTISTGTLGTLADLHDPVQYQFFALLHGLPMDLGLAANDSEYTPLKKAA
jgi:hypothetical protein